MQRFNVTRAWASNACAATIVHVTWLSVYVGAEPENGQNPGCGYQRASPLEVDVYVLSVLYVPALKLTMIPVVPSATVAAAVTPVVNVPPPSMLHLNRTFVDASVPPVVMSMTRLIGPYREYWSDRLSVSVTVGGNVPPAMTAFMASKRQASGTTEPEFASPVTPVTRKATPDSMCAGGTTISPIAYTVLGVQFG